MYVDKTAFLSVFHAARDNGDLTEEESRTLCVEVSRMCRPSAVGRSEVKLSDIFELLEETLEPRRIGRFFRHEDYFPRWMDEAIGISEQARQIGEKT